MVTVFVQAICFVLVRPLSKNTYRRINRVVAELLWLELVWLIDWWAGVQVIRLANITKLNRFASICSSCTNADWLTFYKQCICVCVCVSFLFMFFGIA